MKKIKNSGLMLTAAVMLLLFVSPSALKAQCANCTGYTIVNNLACDIKVDWAVFISPNCASAQCSGTSVLILAGNSFAIPNLCCGAGADIWVTLVDVDGFPVSSITMDGCGPCGTGHGADSGTSPSGTCPNWSITWGINSTTIN
jgi:hypothetical protein